MSSLLPIFIGLAVAISIFHEKAPRWQRQAKPVRVRRG